MHWPNHYSWTDDQENVATLRAVGLNSQEIARLRHLRRVYQHRPNKQDQPQLSPVLAHLLFIRWLVLHGKLSDQIGDVRFSEQAENHRQPLSELLVAEEQASPSVPPMVQRASWLHQKLRTLRAVVARCLE